MTGIPRLFRALALALAAILFLSLPPGPAAARQGGAEQVVVETVRLMPLARTRPVTGRFIAAQTGAVAARTAGPVDDVPVRVGSRVARGDVLAMLDTDRLEAELALADAEQAQAQAGLSEARAALARARQELERVAGLKGSSAFSKGRFQDLEQEQARARAGLENARARLESARARHRLAELELENARVEAPYPGVVTRRHIAAGAYVSPGTPVVSLVNDEDLELDADVPARWIGGLEPGTPVRVALDGEAVAWASVRAVVPEENPLSRTRLVRFTPDFATIAGRPAPGQSVTLHIPVGTAEEVPTVSKDAITFQQGNQVVFVVEEGKARPQPVKTGTGLGDRFAVMDGLAPGDVVVIRGNERLRPGQAVKTRQREAEAEAEAEADGASRTDGGS